MIIKYFKVIDSKILLLGFTFKEDCPDVRNTRVIDIYQELKSFDIQVDVYDPWASADEVRHEYGIEIMSEGQKPNFTDYSAVIVAVAHKAFLDMNICKSDSLVVYDVKSKLPKQNVDARL